MTAGQVYAVSVTMKNTGGTTWTNAAGYRIGTQNPEDNFIWLAWRFPPPASIAPQQNATFSFKLYLVSCLNESPDWIDALAALACGIGYGRASASASDSAGSGRLKK